MSNFSKYRKSTVAVLTALLLIAIAAPLVSFAAAAGAPTASLGTNSGPNGTLVKVSGTGFGANEAVGAITISVDGLSGKAITTTNAAPAAAIAAASQLATNANGDLTGYFIIYGLSAGAHTVIISDASTNVVAGTFTITKPTVTVTPSPVPAGTSVIVSGSGFPVVDSTIETFTNQVTDATFAGTTIAVPAVLNTKTTASATTLSSNIISSSGACTATVALPTIANVPTFTLTDAWGNTATTTVTLTSPTVTLSPTSGPVGTIVTATVTGFGPSSTIASVRVGNVAGSLETAPFVGSAASTAATTEQGTSVFLFTIPAGTTTTLSGVAGAQSVFVADALGNIGNATFTVTPKVTITTGNAVTDSGTTYVPVSTIANLRIAVSGFRPNSALTITASPGIPTEWITPSTWPANAQITNGVLKTDANGAVTTLPTAVDTVLDYPTAAGQYTVVISDGVNSVTTTINVVATGNILAVPVNSGAAGQTGVSFSYFGTTTPTGITLGGAPMVTVPAVLAAPQAWPTATTATFAVTGSAGVRTLALTGGSFTTLAFTTVSPTITVISPSSAAVGTTVTVVGTGFANAASQLAIQGATVTSTTAVPVIGNYAITTFAVPNYLAGTYPLSVSDGTNTATGSITIVAPTVQITPTTGAPTNAQGNALTISITGSGFKAGDPLVVKFDTTTITGTYTGLTTTNTNGGILLLSGYAIPTSTTAGTHTVYVQDATTGAYAVATYTITPKLTAPTAAVRPGAQVAVTGLGFAANSIQSLTINGTATNWVIVSTTPASSITQTSVVTGSTGDLYTASSVGFVVPATQASGMLVVTVTDAAGNTASRNMTVLGTPAIALGASSIVAGTIPTGVSINGTGFTAGSRTITANLYSGSTLVAAAIVTGSPVTVTGTGSFATSAGVRFTVPASVVAGTYTLRVTAANPTETADATIQVLGAPTIVAPTTAASGSNVTITVTGLSAISAATFSSTNLIATSAFGPQTISTTGANAFSTTTWFIVPTGIFAGTYLLTLTDSNTGLSVQTAITVQPTISIAPTTGIKGTTITVTGTGFAASPATVSATLNGQALTLSSTAITATGAISPTFTIPITALATNTLTITDSAGNTASTTFSLTVPTLTVSPATAQAGTTVQLVGSGFTVGSAIVVQVGGQIVTTTPASLTATAGSFIAYVTVPTGLSGNVTVTATDSANNVGTAYVTVGGTGPTTSLPDQTTMTSTAQTKTAAGTPSTTFTSGTSTVYASFVLQTTGSERDVVVAATWQGPDGKVYNMASFQTSMDSTARTVQFSNLIPAGVTGTWTVQLQVFAIDGTTALGVTTLTFTVV